MPANPKIKLTNRKIESSCPLTAAGKGRTIYWDCDIAGFGLLVSRSTRSFIAQKDVGGRTVRVTIGRYGKVWTAERARKEAVQMLAEMDRGGNPNRKRREAAARGVTLEQAEEMHLSDMRKYKRAERSMQDVRDCMRRHLSDWKGRELRSITRLECRNRHDRITSKSGPYAANQTLAVFRAVYNTAASVHDDDPLGFFGPLVMRESGVG